MKKHLIWIVAAAVCMVYAAPALATSQASALTKVGLSEQVTITCPSMATNAIDTCAVGSKKATRVYNYSAISPLLIYNLADTDTAIAAGDIDIGWAVNFQFTSLSGTGGSGSVDSVQVALDTSFDATNWTEQVALTGVYLTRTNHNRQSTFAFTGTAATGKKFPGPYVRLRIKNLGAATGKPIVRVSWPAK